MDAIGRLPSNQPLVVKQITTTTEAQW
jgi:hypothetical protein